MTESAATRAKIGTTAVVLTLAALLVAVLAPGSSEARPKKCFGKKINRVVKGDNKKVRLNYKDVAWIAGDRVTVIGKPYSRICADKGRQFVRPGKGRTWTSTGRDHDTIRLHKSSNKNEVRAGLGNDLIVGSRGHDFLYGSPKNVPKGAEDTDVIRGGGGNDRIFDYGGTGNMLYGLTGSDRIYSLGTSVSRVHGGSGTDFLYSNGGITDSGEKEKLFGEQGNDRLKANRPGNNGPAYLDAGSGDDWVYGTPEDDTIIFHSGIKKLWGNGGDDLFVTAGRGKATVDGGAGVDTISFAAHTPVADRRITGVTVDLQAGTSLGYSRFKLSGFENVVGSSFDDEITGARGQDNVLEGGLGDDVLIGQERDNDTGDGGLGINECRGFSQPTRCNDDSPGNFGNRIPLVDINEGGILTAIGGSLDDRIEVGYERGPERFKVSVSGGAVASGMCASENRQSNLIYCPADQNSLNGMLLYGGNGDDTIRLENSIPATMTTTINGGTGRNTIDGGPSKDFISTATSGAAGSVLRGGSGPDLIYVYDRVTAYGGEDGDALHVQAPCSGASVSGGPGTDSVVFAGAARGVKADLGKGYAGFAHGPCESRTTLARDLEKLEGSAHNDHLIIGRRHKAQQGKSSLLGRDGIDILDAKNGRRDTVTTGAEGRRNKVISDRKDKVIWGWGLAAF